MRGTATRTRARRPSSVLLGLAAASAAAAAAFATTLAGDSYAQTSTRPVNTARPVVTGTPANGFSLRATRGRWRGTPPLLFAFQWLRCNQQGEACVSIPGAVAQTYTVTGADVGRTLRVRVTARNATGSAAATSNPSVIVGAGTVQSVPVTSVPHEERLVVADVRFSPNPVRSRNDVITVRVLVKDTRALTISGASVFMRALPRVTNGDTQVTANDGWATLRLTPNENFRLRPGHNIHFFIQAYRQGESLLAGIAGFRLVQLRMARD